MENLVPAPLALQQSRDACLAGGDGDRGSREHEGMWAGRPRAPVPAVPTPVPPHQPGRGGVNNGCGRTAATLWHPVCRGSLLSWIFFAFIQQVFT